MPCFREYTGKLLGPPVAHFIVTTEFHVAPIAWARGCSIRNARSRSLLNFATRRTRALWPTGVCFRSRKEVKP
jgi:hypothetical protein